MPRFSLKRLLASVTAIAVGISSIAWGLRGDVYPNWPLAALLWLGGAMLIGGGLLAPFRLAVVGAILGFAVQFLLTLFFGVTAFAKWFK